MSELDLIRLWAAARRTIVVSQFAPTALLGFTVWLALEGLGHANVAVRLAAAGILLASGILGALAQFSSASEAQAVASDLKRLGASSATSARIIAASPWLAVVKFVTPLIFVVIYVALLVYLFL
jgi:hypothetical protein